MEYVYEDINVPGILKEGSVLECISSSSSLDMGSIYLVLKIIMTDSGPIFTLRSSSCEITVMFRDLKYYCMVIKTASGVFAKKGDTIIRTPVKSYFKYAEEHKIGGIEKVLNTDNFLDKTIYTGGIKIHHSDCMVLCTKEREVARPEEMLLTSNDVGVTAIPSHMQQEYVSVDTCTRYTEPYSSMVGLNTNVQNKSNTKQKDTQMKLNFKKELHIQVAAQALEKYKYSANLTLTALEKDILGNVDTESLKLHTIKGLNTARDNWDIVYISLYNSFISGAASEDKLRATCCMVYYSYLMSKHKHKDHSWLKNIIVDAVTTGKKSFCIFNSGKIHIYFNRELMKVSLEDKVSIKTYYVDIRYINDNIVLG